MADDKIKTTKTHKPRGKKQPRTRAQIARDTRIIIEMYRERIPQIEIAKKLNLSQPIISKVVTKMTDALMEEAKEMFAEERYALIQEWRELREIYREGYERSLTEVKVHGKKTTQAGRTAKRAKVDEVVTDSEGKAVVLQGSVSHEAFERMEMPKNQVAWLAGIERCNIELGKIFGVYAPNKNINLNLTVEDLTSKTDEELFEMKRLMSKANP